MRTRLVLLLAPLVLLLVPASAGARAAVTYTLTVTMDGSGSGKVTSSPAGISCPASCSYDFAGGTPVTLTATPAAGSSFARWFSTDSGLQPCGGTGTCTVTMDQARSMRATFSQITESLSVLNAYEPGSSGTITISGPGTQLTVAAGTERQAFFNYGASVTVTATPAAGSVFAEWSAPCSGNAGCTVLMTNSFSMEGMFGKAETLKIELAGKGSGTVTATAGGIGCPGTCSGLAAAGFPVTITAVPAAGSYFAGWPISAGCGSTESSCTFDMPQSDDVEVAAFSLDHCLVPNVKRLKLVNARTRLVAYSCRAGKITRAYSAHVKKGAVISEKPKIGSRHERGAKVSLVVSRGRRR